MSSLPLFGDVGQSANDLFKSDKYGFKDIFSHAHKIDNVTVTTAGSAKDFSVEACLKDKVRKAKVKVTSKKAFKISDTENSLGGMPVKASFDMAYQASKASSAKLTAEYRCCKFFAAQAILDGKHKYSPKDGENADAWALEANAMVGFPEYNAAAGASAKLDLVSKNLTDYGLGFQYDGLKSTTLSVTTAGKLSSLKTSLSHKRTGDLTLGSYGIWDSMCGPHTVGFAFQQKISASTLLKGKAEFGDDKPQISLFAEHVLAKPGVKIGFATTTDKLTFKCPSDLLSVSMGFTVGDF